MLVDTKNLIQWTDPADAAFTVIGIAKDTNHTTIDSFGTAIKLLKPLDLSVWLTAQRPALDASGHIIGFASDTGQLELWDGVKWSQVPTISGSAFNGIAIGPTTPSTGAFTTLSASGTLSATGGTVNVGTGSGTATVQGIGTGNMTVKSGSNLMNLSTTGGTALRLNGGTSPVNFFNVTSSATGVDLQFAASGTDTDVTLRLIAKGAGSIRSISPFIFNSSINQSGFASVFAGADNGTPGTTLGYFFGGGFSGTTTGSGPDFFRQTISSDTVSTVPGGINAWSYIYNYGPINGSRRGMQITMAQAGAITDGSGIGTTQFYTVFQPQSGPTLDGGGVATSETINTNNVLHTGATNWDVVDIEQDIAAQAGTNPRVKIGRQVGLVSGDAAPGSIIDSFDVIGVGLATGATNPTRGFRTMWQLGKGGSQWPLEPVIGQLLNIYPQTQANASSQPTRPATALRGFNLSRVNFSDAAWWSPGVWIGGDGTTRITRLQISAGTNGPSVDAPLSVGDYSSVSVAGTGYQVGDQVYDRFDGILVVDAVNGSGGVTLAHYAVKPFVKPGATAVVAVTISTAASTASTALVVGDVTSVVVGDTVVATGVPGGTTVSSISGKTLTLSAAATVALFAPIQFTRTMTPTNPVAFPTGGSGNGALSINLTWTAATQLQLGATVNTVVGTGSVGATTDTSGHLLIPFCAGAPTGIPTNASTGIALRYDTTNHKLWAYDNAASAWKGVALT